MRPSRKPSGRLHDWYDHTLCSRLNDKRNGCIILIMQRLHEHDLVGHVLGQEPWRLVRLPAIAEKDETHASKRLMGKNSLRAALGTRSIRTESLWKSCNGFGKPRRIQFRRSVSAGPCAPWGWHGQSGVVQDLTIAELPSKFELVFQSWDMANKPTELSDVSVCITWRVTEKHLYLLHVLRKRLGYPELKRAVREQAEAFSPKTILIEDKASGTQLIQELIGEGMHAIKKYEPTMDKIMRMHSVTSTVENGFVHIPEKAAWLNEYLQELATFPKGRFDDQADSTSQALEWFKQHFKNYLGGILRVLQAGS